MRSARERANLCAQRLAHLASLMGSDKGSQIVEAADEMREYVDARWHQLADAGREAVVKASTRTGISHEDMGDLATLLRRHDS